MFATFVADSYRHVALAQHFSTPDTFCGAFFVIKVCADNWTIKWKGGMSFNIFFVFLRWRNKVCSGLYCIIAVFHEILLNLQWNHFKKVKWF